MSSSAIKKHLISDEEVQMSAYKKLPPIHTAQKMPARQVISPTSVVVDFNPQHTVQSKQLSGAKVQVRKTAEVSSSDHRESFSLNAGYKKTTVLGTGGKSANKSKGDLPSGDMNNGIELIGYRMTSDPSVTTSENIAASQQATEWTPLSSELPPCRVCGEKASGLHYGVNTCEACKAFFRRTLKKSTVNFQCMCTPEEKLLGTDEPRKTTCPKCRYERCIKTGMSKDAIKIGRYTISRKRQNDREVKTRKHGETSQEVRRVSESSKSTSSSSPYSTSQSVSSPEELSSDITSLSLQEKKVSQKAKKRRHDDEDGLLYQSLTNSIFMSLLDDQQDALQQTSPESLPVEKVQASEKQLVADTTPMEQLLISKNQAETDVFYTESDTNISAADSLIASSEQEIEDFSPLEKILSIYGHTEVDTSPMEQLFMEQAVATTESSLPTTRTTQVDSDGKPHISSPNENVEIPYPNPSDTDVIPEISVKVAGLNPLLYGINDGEKINPLAERKEKLPNTEIVEQSPIENLLTASSTTKPYSTILTVTYNNMFSNMAGNADMTQTNTTILQHGQNANEYNGGLQLSDQDNSLFVGNNANLNGSVQENSESGCWGEDFEAGSYDEADFIENPEDIVIQAMQLYRFENPVIQVGQGISIPDATHMILTLGKAAGALFDNTRKMTCEEIKKRHADYLEQYMLKAQLFGDMSNISKEEYLELYNQTGIDIDNRQQILIEALKYMEESIAKLVKFAKAIPGFSELDIDDQVNLVKASVIEHGLIKPHDTQVCRVSESNVATMPWDQDYHVTELLKLFPAELLELKKVIHAELDEICLSEEEAIVLRAVVITALVSRFEFEMIKLERGKGCVKSAYKVTTSPWDKDYHIEEIRKLFPLEYIGKKVTMSNEFLGLGLSFEESVYFKAIVLTFPASRFEADGVQFGKLGKCVKSSLNVATLPWNKEYHFDEISKIFPRNYCTVKISNLQKVIQLGLSFEETVVLKALVITFPDRGGLKEQQKVEYLHNRLIACFLFMLGNRPPDKLVTVQAVLGTLFKIRRLAAWDTQIIQEMFEVWPVTSNHQLVKEFVS